MTKKKTTKRALLMSALSLMMCVTMFVGSTFAWFTDEVTSANNKIQAGTLQIDLELLEEDGTWSSIKDSGKAIFDYENWEPGFTDVKILRVINEGTLDLKWVAKFVSQSDLTELADVIDVYVNTEVSAYPENRTDLTGWTKVGTVADFVNTISETTKGTLEKDASANLGIALKMQESAGNKYQNMDLGGAFDISIVATQYTSEEDSFDDQYDANAPEMYTVNGVKYETLNDALVAIAAADENDGIVAYFSSLNEPITINKAMKLTIANTNVVAAEGVNAITVMADATIIAEGYNSVVGGKNADGINVADGVILTLTGEGTLITSGNAEKEYFRYVKNGITYGEHISNTTDDSYSSTGGSGIDVAGDIVIDNLANLIAKGYGIGGFGIGGTTDSIIIKNSTVNYARGGFVCPEMFIHDWANHFYGKKEPEGGAAIGSSTDGAVISIEQSTIAKAEGGSKSAGIGARYHTGITVNITDSNVTAYGGNASAGIGGSRVASDATEADSINVNIKNSVINATGGDYAAGIGSGYNTYADKMANNPTTTVIIDAASDVTATGGWLGAGIGTGHNVINFVGDIKCDTTNVKAGYNVDDCCHGALCSEAQDVGLGAYKIEALYTMVNSADELASAVADGKTYLWLNPGEYDVYGCAGKILTISGTKDAVLKVMNEGEDGCDYGFGAGGAGVGNITFNGVTIDTTANTGNYKGYAYMNATFNNCNFFGAYTSHYVQTYNNCYFNFNNGYFWIWGAKEVTFNGCEFGGNSKNILAHGWASSIININSCKFAATEKGYAGGGTIWTAAVEIDPAGTNTYTINFTGENTINENYNGWTRVKDDSTGHIITGLN